MSGGMPELGSKISLISKADIRYEGRLYTVDPQECTIALSSVRSFGTEDRETQFQIAPQSQIYDYILFRGSDIKDIRVVNNNIPHPNDPAIMQVQLPNGQHLMPHFPMPNMNAPHAPPMGTGAYGNPFGGMGALAGLGGAGAAASLAPGTGAPGPYMLGNQQQQQQQQTQQPQQQQQKSQQQQKQPISVIDMLAGGSRSTTPISLISRKSPPGDLQGMQPINSQQQQQQQMLHHTQNNQQQNQSNAGHGGNSRDAGHKRQNHQQRGGNNNNNQRNSNNSDNYHDQRDHQRNTGGRHMDNFNPHHDMRNNYNNQRNQNGQNRPRNMDGRGPQYVSAYMMRNRGAVNRGRMPNQGFRPMGGPGSNQFKTRNNKNTIKFEQDFDFEQANNKFEELRSQFTKLKVGEEPKTEQMNGEVDKKDDSGNETGAGEHEHEEEEITVGYDKTKSFFDNISCEAAQERTKNKKNDWRQERKLNSETFGVSSTRRGGGYRGRGSYYNRNVGSYRVGSGAYIQGYRGGNFRNRSNNRIGSGNNANNSRDNTTNATNTSSTNNNNNLKNQPQQPQATGTNNAATNGAATNPAKSTPLDNNTQPQAASVSAGQ